MNATQLKLMMPRADMAWLLALDQEMPRWGIESPARVAPFIATVAVESAGLTKLEENLFYSDAERVRRVFMRHFDPLDADEAWGYMAQPERFANRIYADRMGNGSEASGEGWRYRGRGPIMVTGKDNYAEMGKAIGFDLLADPDALTRIPAAGCASACRFWKSHGCNELADGGDLKAIRHKVNGGDLGLLEVIHLTANNLKVLAA